MHNLKDIRNNVDKFKSKIKERNVEIDFDKLLSLDKENRVLIQNKEKFEQEKKIISKSKDSKNFEKSKKLSIEIDKLNKKQHEMSLELERNVDILDYVSNHNSLRPNLVVGFAAETNDLENYANKKLDEKNCDWIIANDVSNKSIGFNSDFNEVSIFFKDKKKDTLKYKSKSEISDELVEKIIDH